MSVPFLIYFFLLLEHAPSMPRDQIPPEGPSSDFSSIGPSQSASQISYQLPEPIPNTSPEISSQPTNDKGLPRPHSVASTTASSLYYTPVTPATYKVEAINYAPAISLVVPPSLPSSPREINTPLDLNPSFDGLPPPIAYADEETHTKLYLPAAHAINEYEMPTAKAAETGSASGSGRTLTGWRHSRGDSQEYLGYSSPQPQKTSLGASAPGLTSGLNTMPSNTSSSSTSTINRGGGGSGEQTAVPNRVVRSALIEVFDEPETYVDDEDEDDSELPVEVEDQLIKQGKLAVVENPRFMSEERKKELERQTKVSGAEKDDQKFSESEPGKKNFSFLQQHKRAGTQDTTGHVSFAPVPSATSTTPSTPKGSPSKAGESLPNSSPPKTSPSKRFFGSLKGLFGARPPEVSSPQVRDSSPALPPPSRFRDRSSPSRVATVDLNADSDSDESPAKTRGGFQALLRGASSAKKKDGTSTGGTRWSTRTDKNIRKLTKSGVGDDDDQYDTFLSQDVRNGVAGDIVVKAGLVGAGSRAVRKRSASEIGTAPPGSSSAVTGGGGKKLKKTLPPPAAPAPALQNTSSTQRNDTTTATASVLADTPNPSSKVSRKSSVKTDAPKKRSASVDENATRRRTNVVQQEQGMGQTPVGGGGGGGGGGKEVVVDLGKRRRVSSVIPAMNPLFPAEASARGVPAATTRTPAASASAVSKGYSSDTAVVAAPPTVTPAAATATSSKPTPTRQPSVGKTQTHPTSNPPVENAGGSSRQPPQPHRQHSASSSGGGAIVLTAGATQPTGTLISQPGWNAQAMPTAGGGLSRNNSILSGVSGAPGGSSSGGAGGGGGGGTSKKKKQRQTMLGHGMGSGTSIGRRSSLGSSSGHGGGTVVQPTQPQAQSLMSIVEDVAKHNREWSQESSQLLKNRNKIMGVLEKDKMGPVGMVDVVRAPRRVRRDELSQLDPAMIKARVMETSTTTNLPPASAATGASGGGGIRGRMFDIKAPGSIFDQRGTATVGSASAVQQKVYRQASNSTPDLTQQSRQVNVARRSSVTAGGPAATSTPVVGSKRPAKSPLRSAMKNPSRTPSPLVSPFLVPHLQKQQQAVQEGSRHAVVKSNVGVVAPVPVPPAQYPTILEPQQPSQTQGTSTAATNTMANGTYDSASQRRKGKRKSASNEVGEEAGDSTSGNEIFYTDDEDDDHHGKAVVVPSNQVHPTLNGHAVGYTGSSDLSHSTTSTAAVVHRLPPTTTSPASQPTILVPRRRKSVRVSLQPTFSPSPPAVEDDDNEEQPWDWKQDHRTAEEGSGQQLHVHAPVPVVAGSSLLLNQAHRQKAVAPEPSARADDIWEDSDEDVEYQKAKLRLTRAARKEKDMNVFAARSRS